MEQNQFPVKLFGVAAIAISLTVSACHNNDTATTDSSTDTSKMTTTDTPSRMMNADTGMMKPPADSSAMRSSGMSGMAKPDPSKKGMKGKVMISTPAQSRMKADAAPDATGVYTNVDHIPAFPGGSAGLQKFFDDNVEYPSNAADNGVEGTVMVNFTVDENGKIMSPVVQGDREGYGLDEEALRVINKMPAWVPGKVNGKPVRTRFTLPVKFGLN